MTEQTAAERARQAYHEQLLRERARVMEEAARLAAAEKREAEKLTVEEQVCRQKTSHT